MVIVVSAGLPQPLCVWSAAGGPGSPVVFACVFSVSLHVWGWGGSEGVGWLDVGWSRIAQVGNIVDNSVLLHVSSSCSLVWAC